MNSVTIKELQEKDSLRLNLMVKGVTQGVTNRGASYLNITFQDKSGTIEAKYWDVKREQEELVKLGKIIEADFDVINYKDNLQLRVKSVREVDQNLIDLNDFVIASSIPVEELKTTIRAAITSIQNPIYRKLVTAVFKQVGEEFFEYPAAAKIHHSFLGGLATHVAGMVQTAEAICKLYPQLDHDLLISGVLIHDIGKITELSGPVTTEYTLEGKLIGHISIMQGKLMEISNQLGFGDSEEAILLRHMILAHHGHYEYGSPILPALQEAEVLYLIDNLDARMNTLAQALEDTKPGEFTQKLFALENRSFYKPKK
ncbi:MAG: HD domain-containing protein [Erysipelotrichaceae bacterium]|nr:HD domain-containing protein [Erysipelotrichaceae bacterium]